MGGESGQAGRFGDGADVIHKFVPSLPPDGPGFGAVQSGLEPIARRFGSISMGDPKSLASSRME